MTDTQFACLQRAVNLAREHQIRKLSDLTERLRREKFTQEDIHAAIASWSDYESRKTEPAQ
jgi:hypothetical protein